MLRELQDDGEEMHLSKRLTRVTSFVTKGNRIADIGCDHGYVPIYLVKEGIAESAIAADVRKGPLSRAKEHIQEYGLADKIETRLSDGLEKIAPGEVQSIIIAGMGGLLMIRLLTLGRNTAKQANELVLSPQSDLDEFRRFMVQDGYTICSEAMIKEEGKYYFIFYVKPEADTREWNDAEYMYGKEFDAESIEILKEYLQLQIKKLTELMQRLKAHASDAQERIAQLETECLLAEQKLAAYK